MKWAAVIALALGAACSRGPAPTTTTGRPTTTAPVATTTTASEPEPVRALRAYFDAYARAVQTNDPGLILAHLDQENPAIIRAVTESIRKDADKGDPAQRDVSAIYVEWERVNKDGDAIASVRAIYTYEGGAEAKSFGMIRRGPKWVLTALSREGFE